MRNHFLDGEMNRHDRNASRVRGCALAIMVSVALWTVIIVAAKAMI